MSDLICVTNRNLCETDFLQQVEKIACARPKAIILREKDLSHEDYRALAEKVTAICKRHNTFCILHGFVSVAIALECRSIHLPLSVLRNMRDEEKKYFREIGASCHSAAEADEASSLGCTYIIAGHVFDTDCKKGTPGRGLDFLKSICEVVDLPIFAIGGIGKENFASVMKTGVAGACVMSGFMNCKDPAKFIDEIESTIQ